MDTKEVKVEHNRRCEYRHHIQEHGEYDTHGSVFLKAEEMPVELEGVSYRNLPSQVFIPRTN